MGNFFLQLLSLKLIMHRYGKLIGENDIRLNPEHKSCFKRVFCFDLRSFNVFFILDESVM